MLNKLLMKIAVPSTLLLATTATMLGYADDTELYSVTYAAGQTGKPKVLVIFDDSGSMSTLIPGVKPLYDPAATYQNAVEPNRIYWSNGSTPPSANSDQWFPASKNGCGESINPLAQHGTFNTAGAQFWQPAVGHWETKNNGDQKWEGTPAGWDKLKAADNAPYTVDCRDDVSNGNATNANGIGDGYPYAAVAADTANSEAYINPANNSNIKWTGSSLRFYSSHYLNWYYDDSITPVEKTYLQIAKEVIADLVSTNTSIDFGLAVFNNNTNSSASGSNGGRIVKRIIKNMTVADRTSLISTLNGFTAAGSTPLCETAWESFLYLTGGQRLYGISSDPNDQPLRDTAAENGSGKYISPLEQCAKTYIIYMTDGEPTQDTAADTLVRNKTKKTCRTYGISNSDGHVQFNSCLAPLAEYMADIDTDLDGISSNGKQVAPMATVGFNVGPEATDLLIDTATMTKDDGSPAYYAATNFGDLTEAFNDVVLDILASESTFTAPAVAVDSFSRTQSREEVFFAMFEPSATSDWWGNLKKLKLKQVDNEDTDDPNDKKLIYADVNDRAAIGADGSIKNSARTFWSLTTDGGKVAAGGVGELLKARDLSTRNIVTNTGTSAVLQTFNSTNVTAAAYGLATDADLWSLWQVNDAADLTASINYGWGYDTQDADNDNSRTDTRSWIMADILHSTPLTINYGARGNFTQENPDLRIVAGTNDGLLHMFSNNDGQETWAFFPKELGAALTQRRKNTGGAGQNVYGVDGAPVSYIIDANRDGTIKASDDGDKAYVYFGLRRGGNQYYALDVTDPDKPVFLWTIGSSLTGFGELGQSWSKPIVTRIPGYKDANGAPKTVLIFGGGYDTVKDSHATLATPSQDTMGRGLFIVDALTGAKVWSITPADNSATNMQATGLVHSFPAEVSILDSNGDSLTDRVYMADSGGNLWRVDMPGNALPDTSQNTWFIVKLFETVESTDTRTKRTDRRFFNKPNVVKTVINGAPVDVITIGTGDRTNPIAKDHPTDTTDPTADDQYYMIKDAHTNLYRAARVDSDCNATPPADFRCLLPLNPGDLYDITDNKIQTGTDEERAAEKVLLDAAHGWRLDLTGNGEKNLSDSRTLDGKVEFNTYTPGIDPKDQCEVAEGLGRNYLIDMFTGVPEQDCNDDGTKTRSCAYSVIIPPLDALVVTDDGTIWNAPPPGEKPDGDLSNPQDTGSTMQGPYGNYWEREDF